MPCQFPTWPSRTAVFQTAVPAVLEPALRVRFLHSGGLGLVGFTCACCSFHLLGEISLPGDNGQTVLERGLWKRPSGRICARQFGKFSDTNSCFVFCARAFNMALMCFPSKFLWDCFILYPRDSAFGCDVIIIE